MTTECSAPAGKNARKLALREEKHLEKFFLEGLYYKKKVNCPQLTFCTPDEVMAKLIENHLTYLTNTFNLISACHIHNPSEYLDLHNDLWLGEYRVLVDFGMVDKGIWTSLRYFIDDVVEGLEFVDTPSNPKIDLSSGSSLSE